MKIQFFSLSVLLLLSCQPGTQSEEQKMLDCWTNTYVNRGDSSTLIQLKGIEWLEKFLLDNHYLKGTQVSDYMDMVNDTQQVIVPESAPGFNSIALAFEGDPQRTVDINSLIGCFETNMPSKKDSADALYRLADLYLTSKDHGFQHHRLFEYYSTLTTKEFQRPFIKLMVYMNLNHKISLRKRTFPIYIDLPQNDG